jgi:hypothetical protein
VRKGGSPQALESVKTLRGFIPMCAHCKKIRRDDGFCDKVEAFVSRHSEAEFSLGICPDCAEKIFPGMDPIED